MNKQMKGNNMLIPTLIMAAVAIALLIFGYVQGNGAHIEGIRSGALMLIQLFPLLLLAFLVAGLVQHILPHEVISKWIGQDSGIRGILIGTIAGGFSPGGPYVNLPLAGALYRSGASIGTMVAFLTGWSLWAVARLPMEIGILGWRLALIRIASTFFFPPIAGLIANMFFGSK